MMVKSNFLANLPYCWLMFFRIVITTILIGFLVGCPSNVSKQIDFDESKSSQYYLSQFLATSGTEKTNWQLLAIRSLILNDDTQKARQLMNELPSNLNIDQQKEVLLLKGELAVKNNQNFNIDRLTLSSLNDNQKIRYYRIKISLDGQNNDINGKIHDYIELKKYGTNQQQHMVINETWDFLTSLDDNQINSILIYADESILQGWIDLIYSYKNNANTYTIEKTDDPDEVTRKTEAQLNLLKHAVRDWQMQYSNHPAALYLPRNIYGEKYRLPDDTNNKNIALFLPLSGSSKVFGDTIEQGYRDASKFYPGDVQQNIYVFDTNSNSIENLITQAQQQDINLIVGPLLKQDVLSIAKLAPDLPVLALNQVDSVEHFTNKNKMCFVSLSPENEAEDAANHIYNQKKKLPLLIVPNSDLGIRVANSFAKKWRQIDTTSNGVYVQYFDSEKDLSSKMNSGVGIELEGVLLDDSQPNIAEQYNLSPDTLSNDVGFVSPANLAPTPAFGAIYIYASYNELALIKSMLEMASSKMEMDAEGNLLLDNKGNTIAIKKIIPPLYSSSKSNIGDSTQDFRYDMEGMQFSDIPLITTKNQLIDELPSYIKNDYSLIRLYALGVDAWRLANRFNQLEPYQIDVLDGMTGKLSVEQPCEISRAYNWLRYLKGESVIVR